MTIGATSDGVPSPAAPPLPAAINVGVDPEPDEPDVPDADDDEDLPDGDDDSGDDEEPGDPSAAQTPDEVAALKARIAQLEARARQAEEYEAHLAAEQAAAQQANNEAYWENAFAQGRRWYADQKARVYANADDAIAPVAYIRQQMEIVDDQYTRWLDETHAAREYAYYQVAVQEALPNWVAEVAAYYGLPRDVVPELLTYPPDIIPREAERMKQRRDADKAAKRKATQRIKAEQRKALEQNSVFTGSGRTVGVDIEAGSDEQYMTIPWERVSR